MLQGLKIAVILLVALVAAIPNGTGGFAHASEMLSDSDVSGSAISCTFKEVERGFAHHDSHHRDCPAGAFHCAPSVVAGSGEYTRIERLSFQVSFVSADVVASGMNPESETPPPRG